MKKLTKATNEDQRNGLSGNHEDSVTIDSGREWPMKYSKRRLCIELNIREMKKNDRRRKRLGIDSSNLSKWKRNWLWKNDDWSHGEWEMTACNEALNDLVTESGWKQDIMEKEEAMKTGSEMAGRPDRKWARQENMKDIMVYWWLEKWIEEISDHNQEDKRT